MEEKNLLKEDYIPFLDGIRGFAALWVVCSHSLILSGSRIPLLNRGDIAVDLFMVMSGFLMTYHYYIREQKEPWQSPSTWRMFYIRRFFRIAPLYYFIFFVSLILGSYLFECRSSISSFYPGAVTDPVRYLDHSLKNILLHITFVFGLIPNYGFRTPLPDWSIGLEMQFYLVFPFLMLVLKNKSGLLWTFLIILFSFILQHFLIKDSFPMPSFLLLKILYFYVGIFLAIFNQYKFVGNPRGGVVFLVSALFLSCISGNKIFPLGIFLIILMLLSRDNLMGFNKVILMTRFILSNRFSKWLADMSYGVYLIHLIFMLPIASTLLKYSWYKSSPDFLRFIFVVWLTSIFSYGTSMILFKMIEKPGIIFGKRFITKGTL